MAENILYYKFDGETQFKRFPFMEYHIKSRQLIEEIAKLENISLNECDLSLRDYESNEGINKFINTLY